MNAAADPIALRSVDGPVDPPKAAANERVCERPDSPGLLRTLERHADSIDRGEAP